MIILMHRAHQQKSNPCNMTYTERHISVTQCNHITYGVLFSRDYLNTKQKLICRQSPKLNTDLHEKNIDKWIMEQVGECQV